MNKRTNEFQQRSNDEDARQKRQRCGGDIINNNKCMKSLMSALENTLDQTYDEAAINPASLASVTINDKTKLYLYGDGGPVTPKILRILKYNIESVAKDSPIWTVDDAPLLNVLCVEFLKEKVFQRINAEAAEENMEEPDNTAESMHKLLDFFNIFGVAGEPVSDCIPEFDNTVNLVLFEVVSSKKCTKACKPDLCDWRCDWDLARECLRRLFLRHQQQEYNLDTEFAGKFMTICSEGRVVMSVFGKHISMVYVFFTTLCMVANILKLYVSTWFLTSLKDSKDTLGNLLQTVPEPIKQQLKNVLRPTFNSAKSCYRDFTLLNYLDTVYAKVYMQASTVKHMACTPIFALTFLYHLTMINVCIVSARSNRISKNTPVTEPVGKDNVNHELYFKAVNSLHDSTAMFYERFVMMLLDAISIPQCSNNTKTKHDNDEIFVFLRRRCIEVKDVMKLKTAISKIKLTEIDMSVMLDTLILEFAGLAKKCQDFVTTVNLAQLCQSVFHHQ